MGEAMNTTDNSEGAHEVLALIPPDFGMLKNTH